jgi:diguanylate cyclase (GGDEF)-like protein/PAS domain S-box-containing protein
VVGAAVTLFLALAVVAASAVAVLDREHAATRNLQGQVALADVAHQVDAVRYAPNGVINGQPMYAQMFPIENQLIRQATLDAGKLARLWSSGAAIRSQVRRLNELMTRELTLVAGHRLPAARAVDHASVTPLYNQLLVEENRGAPVLAAAAKAASHQADLEIVGIVAGCSLLLALMLASFEASRRRRVRTSVQQEGLRASEQRFRALVQNSSDMITVVSPTGTITFQAPSVRGVLGHEPADLEGAKLSEFVHLDDSFKVHALCGTTNRADAELRLRHVDGTWRTCEVRGSSLVNSTNVRGVVLNIRDVTERKTLEDELRHQAFHDSLTGLANRALFADRMEHAVARQRRSGEPLAVLLIDLDEFKAINDSLGHDHGDRLLTEVAIRLRSAARASDTVARLGGDEFAILLEDPTDGSAPEHVAERVMAGFAHPIDLDGHSLLIGASIGAAVATPELANADELLRNADVAMYTAKLKGKGDWTLFKPGMHVAIQERLQLKTDLVAALSEGDQMELYYQPIVSLKSGEAVGVEALLRWNHPTRGLVPPLDFLPLAEDLGLIIPLGKWVLREACDQAVQWRARHHKLEQLTMSVNVSGRQLKHPDLVNDVYQALNESGLDPAALLLEITETVLMDEAESTIEVLNRLKALGIRVAIDDFGTGYSSLGYLQRFPIDVLKVDRSFTAGLAGEPRQAALAEAVVKIGATLNLQTVAEGVELDTQTDSLQSLDCDYAQGYLYAKPLPAIHCEALLAKTAELVRTPIAS